MAKIMPAMPLNQSLREYLNFQITIKGHFDKKIELEKLYQKESEIISERPDGNGHHDAGY